MTAPRVGPLRQAVRFRPGMISYPPFLHRLPQLLRKRPFVPAGVVEMKNGFPLRFETGQAGLSHPFQGFPVAGAEELAVSRPYLGGTGASGALR